MRYITIRPRQFDDWEFGVERQTMTVHVEDDDPVPTGLLDMHGVPLYRLPDRVPFGFHVSKPRVRVKAPRG